MDAEKQFDLCVVGGGSGGFAAALAAARGGLKVLVVERSGMLGGTATQGGVNCWEPGCGGTGVPFDLYRRMRRNDPQAIGVTSSGRHFSWQDAFYWPHALDKVNFPGGEWRMDPTRHYGDTLRRHTPGGRKPDEGWTREHWHGVVFLPERMAACQHKMLTETGNVDIRFGSGFTAVEAGDGRVRRVRLSDGSTLAAGTWVDATGGIFSHALGCETLRGTDPLHRFNEPHAPPVACDAVNAVSLIYRVMPGYPERIEPLPAGIPAACWWAEHFPPMSCVEGPDRGRTCNMLPTMEGRERIALGYAAAYAECLRRLKAHWHFVQTHWGEFRSYRMTWVAPMLGIRESRRVVCEKMLTENDIVAGLHRQTDPDIIAIADHAMDRHGESGGCPELAHPYGVPFRCLIPKGWKNLLVAGRAAGFSSIAASSCRLTRTMMQLGQAAGTAASLARETGVDVAGLDPESLRGQLMTQHVQLDFPLSATLAAHIQSEGSSA